MKLRTTRPVRYAIVEFYSSNGEPGRSVLKSGIQSLGLACLEYENARKTHPHNEWIIQFETEDKQCSPNNSNY